jgi:hypothetical protein
MESEQSPPLIEWFITAPEAVFDHREVSLLADISYTDMQNWRRRNFFANYNSAPDANRRYRAEPLVTIATAARLVEQGVAPASAFLAAHLVNKELWTCHFEPLITKDDPNAPWRLDFRDFFAATHILPETIEQPERVVQIMTGSLILVMEAIAKRSGATHSVLAIGKIWFDLAQRAYDLKRVQAENARKANNPRKRAAGA